MSKSIQLIEMYKKHKNIESDYAAAKLLKISRATVSKWRNGYGMDYEIADNICREIGIDSAPWIAEIAGEREIRPKMKKRWQEIARRLETVVIASVVALPVFIRVTEECILC